MRWPWCWLWRWRGLGPDFKPFLACVALASCWWRGGGALVVLLESILALPMVRWWCVGDAVVVALAVGQCWDMPRMTFSRAALGVHGVVFVFRYDPS